MFDFVQKHKRVLQVFLGLIALTFATWGIESYTRFAGGRDVVASVNGSDITQREFEVQVAAQQEQIRRMFAGRMDPATFDTPEGRRAVLEQMINERIIATETLKRNLQIDDKRLAELIMSVPEFQENGRFSVEAFDRVARSQNPPLSSRQFEERLRQMFAFQHLVGAVGDTTIVAHAVAGRLAAIEAQQREVSEARLAGRQYLDKVKIDAAKVKEYYDANPGEFRTPERVRAEYLVLSAENLAKQETATEDEIKQAYEARASAFKVEEQRRASHILVKTKEEADRIAAELKKNPAAFAELAKKDSQDPGSAEKGGDLGWFARGAMVKPFEDAVFSMKQGETGVAQSEFGFHVLKVTGIQPGKTRPLDDVRKELAAGITKQKAAKKYAESSEAFGNMVYAKGGPPQELGALDNPKLLAALFSQDAIANTRNTDAVEVAPSTLVAARVVEHQQAAQRKFEEVKEQIADQLRRREATRLAEQDGMAKLEQLKKGENPALQWGAARMVSRRNAQGLPAEILRQVVAADAAKLPAYVGVALPDQGYSILRISKVVEGGAPADEKQAEARANAAQGGADYEAYVATLKGRASISVNSANLEKK